MVSCFPGAAFIDGKKSKIFTKLDIAVKLSDPAMGAMFTGKRGFIPAKIGQVPITPPPPTALEKEVAATVQAAKTAASSAKAAKEAAAALESGEAVAQAEAADMETETSTPPQPTKYIWAAVKADGTAQKLDPKTDLVQVSALEGHYELGLANFCPYHAVNGLLLHKGAK